MKKRNVVLICILAVVILLGIGILNVMPKKQKVGDVAECLAKLEDGQYIGKCENGIVGAEVEVMVEDHKMTAIKILEHRNGKGQAAEAITDDVIENQSLDVDAVSGATYSSYTILKAIENAVQQ